MRFDGIIQTWNDDRGFGFISPTQGGQEVFVHIKAFRRLRERPCVQQQVSFEVELDARGKKRAFNVEMVRQPRTKNQRAPRDNKAQWGAASLFAIPAFLIVLLVTYIIWHPPTWFVWVYVALSVLTFLVYYGDKSAAKVGAQRTPESTLHTLALAGGWPGALLAQQLLRHKSVKADFRFAFWVTVVLNVAGFIALAVFLSGKQ